jgi:hypothetical protein
MLGKNHPVMRAVCRAGVKGDENGGKNQSVMPGAWCHRQCGLVMLGDAARHPMQNVAVCVGWHAEHVATFNGGLILDVWIHSFGSCRVHPFTLHLSLKWLPMCRGLQGAKQDIAALQQEHVELRQAVRLSRPSSAAAPVPTQCLDGNQSCSSIGAVKDVQRLPAPLERGMPSTITNVVRPGFDVLPSNRAADAPIVHAQHARANLGASAAAEQPGMVAGQPEKALPKQYDAADTARDKLVETEHAAAKQIAADETAHIRDAAVEVLEAEAAEQGTPEQAAASLAAQIELVQAAAEGQAEAEPAGQKQEGVERERNSAKQIAVPPASGEEHALVVGVEPAEAHEALQAWLQTLDAGKANTTGESVSQTGATETEWTGTARQAQAETADLARAVRKEQQTGMELQAASEYAQAAEDLATAQAADAKSVAVTQASEGAQKAQEVHTAELEVGHAVTAKEKSSCQHGSPSPALHAQQEGFDASFVVSAAAVVAAVDRDKRPIAVSMQAREAHDSGAPAPVVYPAAAQPVTTEVEPHSVTGTAGPAVHKRHEQPLVDEQHKSVRQPEQLGTAKKDSEMDKLLLTNPTENAGYNADVHGKDTAAVTARVAEGGQGGPDRSHITDILGSTLYRMLSGGIQYIGSDGSSNTGTPVQDSINTKIANEHAIKPAPLPSVQEEQSNQTNEVSSRADGAGLKEFRDTLKTEDLRKLLGSHFALLSGRHTFDSADNPVRPLVHVDLGIDARTDVLAQELFLPPANASAPELPPFSTVQVPSQDSLPLAVSLGSDAHQPPKATSVDNRHDAEVPVDVVLAAASAQAQAPGMAIMTDARAALDQCKPGDHHSALLR